MRFKLSAVRLSQEPGVQVQTVARALEIHPFMLSKWRRDVREGRILSPELVVTPPLEVFPEIVARVSIPSDVESVLVAPLRQPTAAEG